MATKLSKPALERFHRAASRMVRILRDEDAAAPLSGARAAALSILLSDGPQALGDLARAQGVKPPTMSRLVKEMRIDGLVEPLAQGADRRQVRVAASTRGRRLLLEARARRHAAIAKLLRGASAREIAALEAVAGLLERALAPAESSSRRRMRG